MSFIEGYMTSSFDFAKPASEINSSASLIHVPMIPELTVLENHLSSKIKLELFSWNRNLPTSIIRKIFTFTLIFRNRCLLK